MKKIFYTILFLSAFGIFNIAHASNISDYSRTPNTDIEFPNTYDLEFKATVVDANRAYILKIEDNTNTVQYTSACLLSSTSPEIFNLNDISLPVGEYDYVYLEQYVGNLNCNTYALTTNLEGNGTATIFEVTEPPPTELEILQEMKDNLESFLLIFLFFFIFFNFVKLFK